MIVGWTFTNEMILVVDLNTMQSFQFWCYDENFRFIVKGLKLHKLFNILWSIYSNYANTAPNY